MDATTTLPLGRPDPLTPPPAYAALRATAPVTRVVTAHGTTAWLITSYASAAAALADPRLGMTPPGVDVDERASLFQDGEPHARLRRLVARAFTPRSVGRLAPRIEAHAERLVAAMAEAGPPLDLVDALAAPLSIAVIADLFGVDPAEHGRFRALADAALAADPMAAGEDPELLAAAEEAWGALAGLAGELVEARRAVPHDDLVGALVAVRDVDDGRLGDGELVALVAALVGAGALTVRSGITSAVVRLLAEDALAEATGPHVATLVDEVIRCGRQEPFPRWALADLELGGIAIPAGDMVLVRLEAADRDPGRFADPETFRPGRPGPHLGFGRGPHHCLGAALARAELTIALGALARSFPSLRLAVDLADVPWTDGEVDSGPLALPVTWDEPAVGRR